MKDFKYILLSLLAITLAVGLDWYNDYMMPRYSADVIYIYDGDTFTADIKFEDGTIKRGRVRIRNIDTPEIEGKCTSEIKKAQKAKKALIALIAEQPVNLKDIGIDKYDRTLAIIYNHAGIDIGQALIKSGDARPYEGYRKSWCN